MSKCRTKTDSYGRVCTVCKEYKIWPNYGPNARHSTGFMSRCRACSNLISKPKDPTKKYLNQKESMKKRAILYRITKPFYVKSQQIRSSLLRRGRRDTTASRKEIENWLKNQELICFYSKEPLNILDISIDHRIPISRGGDNKLINLCICSKEMNLSKGSMTSDEFISLLGTINNWEDKGKSLLSKLRQVFFVKRS